MLKIAIILGSTRPGRNGEPVAHWVYEHAQKHGGAEFELIDLKEYPLPHLDEPMPPAMGKYSHHTPRPGLRRSIPSTPSSSSRPSTTTGPPPC